MPKKKSQKKTHGRPRPLAIVLLVLLLVGGALIGFLLFRSDDNKDAVNDTETYSYAQDDSVPTQVRATFNSTVSSDNELRAYIDAIDTSTTPTVIEPGDIDWATHDVVPVDFYLPSGQQPQELSYVDANTPLSLNVLKAPEGCTFFSVQRHYYAFAVVDSGVVVSQPDIDIVYLDNPDQCIAN